MKEKLKSVSGYLQRIGKSLMLPIAVLPLAALLLGFGYALDSSGWGANNSFAAVLVKSGGAILDNLPMIFAVGAAYGMSRGEDRGASMLSGLIAYLTITTLLSSGAVAQITQTPADDVSAAFGKINNTFIGIIAGVLAGHMYNALNKKELPNFLAFFSGKRLVPIATGFASIAVAMILLFVWPVLFDGLVSFGQGIGNLEHVGAGIYAFFNRLLIPFGLHHALNSVFWFDGFGINDIGSFWGGQIILDNGMHVGTYMAGFFPIFMFGLPMAAFAMYKTSFLENRKYAKSVLIAGAITSLVTGVTEPLEFSFLFVAPMLFGVHAILTGLSVMMASAIGGYAGFAFSAGTIDYLLSIPVAGATDMWKLLPQGLMFGALYFITFTFLIKKFNLKTIGRETVVATADGVATASASSKGSNWDTMAANLLKVIGEDNLVSIDNCATRLRLEVKDSEKITQKDIKAAGGTGLMKMGKTNIQIIIGPKVQFVADALRGIKK